VEWITNDVKQLTRRANVVCEATNRCGVALHVVFLPLSEETNKEIALEFAMKNLRKEVKIRNEGSLQDDRDI